jgi:mono/diheme cytochrome c family protein
MASRSTCTALLLAALLPGAVVARGEEPPARVDFTREVRPLLARRCFACHGPDAGARQADLRLDRGQDARRERDGYRVIAPGDPAGSELVARIISRDEPMPPPEHGERLAPEEVALLTRWIEEGARYLPHWAFVPPRRATPPEVAQAAHARGPLDRFVLARAEAAGLTPAPEADRYTLARRLSLDLTGLPPSFEAARAFAQDPRPDAYELLVERLLASPAYGERWAAVWLDQARYADSTGHGSDPLRSIWRYRDWVIDAYNRNLPYDEFIIEQLAGDLLPNASGEQHLATAFHRNTMTNTEGGTDDEEFRVAAVKDRVNTTGQVFLGLTFGCAQCHSHKFDPISQAEYYGFFDFFNQTADTDRPDDAPLRATPTAEQARAFDDLTARIDALVAERDDPERDVAPALARWEEARAARAARWRPLAPLVATSSGGATLTVAGDASIQAAGASPETDVYTLRFAPPGRVKGLRLEVLPDREQPAGGPGRAPGNGNIVLNDVELRVPGGPPVAARSARIDLPGARRILSLAEVEVLVAGENVAPRGAAAQSSVAYAGPAERAIDGNTSGVFSDGSVTHTATEDDPWWTLDLGATHAVEGLRVWNRTDGDLEQRLAGLRVALLDEAGAVVWRSAPAGVPAPVLALGPADGARIAFARASADYSQPDWSIDFAIDGRQGGDSGWGLSPRLGLPHHAVFELAEPLAAQELELALHQEYGAHHTIGRLRVSFTDADVVDAALSRELAAVVAQPAAARSAVARALLTEHFRSIDPALAGLNARIAALLAERDALDVQQTPVMVELPPDRRRTTHVLIKGNFLQQGEVVTAAVPAALHAWPADAPRDRLGLARWIASEQSPLTARVAVNRVWARLFGTGLVETQGDFGAQGAQPSHPALLDWLAVEFMQSGWDQKALLRTIVTSATYRQASRADAGALARDPQNRLLARGPRFRLEAEMVRDVALSISGLLSHELHGPSVYPPQPDGLWQAAFNGQRTWPTSTGAARFRRGVYVFLRRTIPYPSLDTFDAPSREVCTVRRIRTNTPLQALVTLNDPVFVEAAQGLARRILREVDGDDLARAARGLELALARPAEPARARVIAALVADARAHFAQRVDEAALLAGARRAALGDLPAGADVRAHAAWTVAANVLLNQDAVLVKN